MNSLGISSVYSPDSVSSIYKSMQASYSTNKQADSGLQNSQVSSPVGEIEDKAIISYEANALLSKDKENTSDKSDSAQKPSQNEQKLTPAQEQEIAKLKARDAEVKAHEQAHIAASAGLSVSTPSYSYQTGPDGVKYAVGGEIGISFVQSKDPEENIANAQTMKAAALAPADPSAQDLAVARNADQIIQEAREQLKEQRDEENKAKDESASQEGIAVLAGKNIASDNGNVM